MSKQTFYPGRWHGVTYRPIAEGGGLIQLSGDVAIEIDFTKLCRQMVAAALRSKSHKSTKGHGAIILRVTNIAEHGPEEKL